MTSTAGSPFLALMVMSAPSRLACSNLPSSISTAHTNNPIAFSKRAVFCVAAKFCFSTYRFACGEAVFTMSTRRIQRRHTHAIALFDRRLAAAERGDNADTFVSGRKRQRGFDRPITIGRVQVGMTYPARLGFHQHQHLPRPRRGDLELPYDRRTSKCLDHGGLHFFTLNPKDRVNILVGKSRHAAAFVAL